MLIYILIDLALIVMGLFAYQKTRKEWALVLSFLLLLFFAGLRGDFTADYRSYADYFLKTKYEVSLSEILSLESGYSMEKGFVLLLRLIGYITASPVVLFTILSILTLSLYYAGFRRLSAMPMLTVLLFATVGDYYATYNLVRQTLAASIMLLGLSALTEGRRLRFLGYVIAAMLIHRTSIVMLPVSLLLNVKVTKKSVALFCGVGVAAYILLPRVVSYVQSIFSMYASYQYGMGEGTINAVIPSLGMLAFVAYSIFWGNCDFDLDDRKNRIMLNGAILSTIMLFLGMRIYIVSRVAYYLKPCFWILLPDVIASYRNERERRIILVAICLIAIAFNYITLSGTGYDPYYFAFE